MLYVILEKSVGQRCMLFGEKREPTPTQHASSKESSLMYNPPKNSVYTCTSRLRSRAWFEYNSRWSKRKLARCILELFQKKVPSRKVWDTLRNQPLPCSKTGIALNYVVLHPFCASTLALLSHAGCQTKEGLNDI